MDFSPVQITGVMGLSSHPTLGAMAKMANRQ